MALCTFNAVPQRLGAIRGLVSDHVPIAFTVTVGHRNIRIVSANISNEDAHKWFSKPGNAYAETDLVATPEQLKGKMQRQLEEIAALLANGTYDIALIQEADSFSVTQNLNVDIYSSLEDPASPFHGKTWALQCIMVARRAPYTATFRMLTGEFTDGDRKVRTELPTISLYADGEHLVNIACAHVRGNDSQNPAAGIQHAAALFATPEVPLVMAGDFNTTPDNIRAALGASWQVAEPKYYTHMCKLDTQYCLAVYDNVVFQGCDVKLDAAQPPLMGAETLRNALI